MPVSLPFILRATLSDGFSFTLGGGYATEREAQRAAERYMRDYSDPCGLGVHVSQVAIIDCRLVELVEEAA